jgi:hypothetical protein
VTLSGLIILVNDIVMRLLSVNDHALESVGHQSHMLVFIFPLDYQIVRFCYYVPELEKYGALLAVFSNIENEK